MRPKLELKIVTFQQLYINEILEVILTVFHKNHTPIGAEQSFKLQKVLSIEFQKSPGICKKGGKKKF